MKSSRFHELDSKQLKKKNHEKVTESDQIYLNNYRSIKKMRQLKLSAGLSDLSPFLQRLLMQKQLSYHWLRCVDETYAQGILCFVQEQASDRKLMNREKARVVITIALHYFFVLIFTYKRTTIAMNQYFLSEDNELTKGSQETYTEIDRIGSYLLTNRIAKSGQATIYLSKKEGRDYALKVYESTPKNDRIFENEVHTLSKIQLRGIVPMEECMHRVELVTSHSEESILCNVIVMPYAQKGDLLEWVLTKKRFEERAGRYFALQIFARFRYLESKNIFHRDIKAENILIGDDYRPLLIDFGLATDSNQVGRSFAGTARYASPEVVKEKEYTSKSEIYSLGILFFFILTGTYPYSIAKITDPGYRLLVELKFQRFWGNFELKQHIKLSDSFKKLFERMVDHNPSKRPCLDELLQFEWFRQDSMSYQQFTAYMQAKDQCFQ